MSKNSKYDNANLIARIKDWQAVGKALRKELSNDLADYFSVPYADMYQYYQLLKAKQAEKFIEGWVASLIGGSKIKRNGVPAEYANCDLGDIQASDELIVGVNNIELKSTFANGIGGGQFRFYEPVPFYLFFKAWDETRYEMFLLSKDELVHEIITRPCRSGKIFSSSQGSGDINKLNKQERIERLHQNVMGEKQDKIGWGFNPKTEEDYYTYFRSTYGVSANQVSARIEKENIKRSQIDNR